MTSNETILPVAPQTLDLELLLRPSMAATASAVSFEIIVVVTAAAAPQKMEMRTKSDAVIVKIPYS